MQGKGAARRQPPSRPVLISAVSVVWFHAKWYMIKIRVFGTMQEVVRKASTCTSGVRGVVYA